eukprot:799566-Pelagomonas_calceolata.AAC.4
MQDHFMSLTPIELPATIQLANSRWHAVAAQIRRNKLEEQTLANARVGNDIPQVFRQACAGTLTQAHSAHSTYLTLQAFNSGLEVRAHSLIPAAILSHPTLLSSHARPDI